MANISEILELIKIKRKERGITHEEIAKALGITITSYARIEKGETEMKLAIYLDICKFLGVELLVNKPESKETNLITNKETDINSLSDEIRSTNKKIDNIEDKLDEVLKLFKGPKRK